MKFFFLTEKRSSLRELWCAASAGVHETLHDHIFTASRKRRCILDNAAQINCRTLERKKMALGRSGEERCSLLEDRKGGGQSQAFKGRK